MRFVGLKQEKPIKKEQPKNEEKTEKKEDK
jgi:hypothetical protein